MATAVMTSMATTGASMMMGSACAESPDYTAITAATGNAIEDLEGQLNALTGAGGLFQSKADSIVDTRNIQTDSTLHQGTINTKNIIKENQNLMDLSNFAQQGSITMDLNEKITDVNKDLNNKFNAINVSTNKAWVDLESEQFQTVSQMEREMNSILAQYAGTTGESWTDMTPDFGSAYNYNLRS